MAVLADDWDAVLRGDDKARSRIAKELHGVNSYFHNLTFSDADREKHWVLVSIVTLMDIGIVECITLNCGL